MSKNHTITTLYLFDLKSSFIYTMPCFDQANWKYIFSVKSSSYKMIMSAILWKSTKFQIMTAHLYIKCLFKSSCHYLWIDKKFYVKIYRFILKRYIILNKF